MSPATKLLITAVISAWIIFVPAAVVERLDFLIYGLACTACGCLLMLAAVAFETRTKRGLAE